MTDGTSMDLGGGGSTSFQYPNGVGTTGRARILDFRTEQQTHYEDGNGYKKGDPKTFPDGKPMTKVVVELQTQYRNSEGLKVARPAGTDDGKRSVHLQAHKSPDTTSSMAAVMAATTPIFGKGRIRVGDDMELIGLGEVKTAGGQLARKHTANYWAAEAGVDLAPAAPVVPTPAPAAVIPAVPAPAPTPAAVPAPPSAPATAVADPLLANLTPAQLAVLGQQAAPAVPPPPAVPAPPAAVPPPPAVKVTPDGFTLDALVGNGWSREQALAAYPMLG